MTNSVNYQTQPIPGYPNIVINVTGSNIAAPDDKFGHHHCCCNCVPQPNIQPYGQYASNPYEAKPQVAYINRGEYLEPVETKTESYQKTTESKTLVEKETTPDGLKIYEVEDKAVKPANNDNGSQVQEKNTSEKTTTESVTTAYNNPQKPAETDSKQTEKAPQYNQSQAGNGAYPPSYYINNYNIQNGDSAAKDKAKADGNGTKQTENVPGEQAEQSELTNKTEDDTNTSKEIINELNIRQAEQKEAEKNSKKTRVVALTNEYIMSLENYLNNPNTEIRLMAAKDILTRLDEDKDRYDDAALNALLNKMLQDPNKLVRIAAMSAFSSELASGNQYTVELLTQIQKNPQADPEDVLEASQILLKRTATTEVRYVPVKNENVEQQQKVEE